MTHPIVLFVSPVSTHGTEGNHARLFSLVEAVRTLGYQPFLCLVDLPALGSQAPNEAFKRYWGDHYAYFKTGWKWRKSTWSLPIKGLFLVGMQRLLGKLISRNNRVFKHVFNFQFIDQWEPKEFDAWLQKFASEKPLQAIICEYAFLAGTLPAPGLAPTRIIDTHDVFTDRNKRLKYQFNWINFSASQETTLLNRADHVIAIQEEEASFFKQQLKVQAKVHCIDIITPACASETRIPGIPAIGYLASSNDINIEAVNWFTLEIWPLIHTSLPNVKLRIAGGISRHLRTPLNNVEVLGIIDDIPSFYESCSCIVNPALSGTGLKIKTIEALRFGKPVVCTSEGASGLKQWQGSGFYISDSPKEFADSCIRILSDMNLSKFLSESGKQFINERYQQNLNRLGEIIKNG